TKVREGLGGRIRSFSSGSAPLSRELLDFFWSIGIKIYQGYGLTETSPVVSTNTPEANRLGTVGRPIPNCEVRIAEDGEILVRGPNVMRGYLALPEDTHSILNADGWLYTGDIGHIDADGFLSITDRKKDLIKTAAGKFVAPQPIENSLKECPLIENALIVGDRRRFVGALLVPNFARLESRAREEGVENRGRTELLQQPKVREWLAKEVESVNARLAQYETIKRFALLEHDFTIEGGELTYTMKVKRRAIEKKYADIIERLYAETENVPLAQGL
ncbi:MAG: AMP-binding protein, partial [Acidobacteria bacterium]|nr:AMP-binding protein [Acidobacteriota bacterium]